MIAGVLLALGTSVCWAFGNVFIQKSGKVLGAPRAMLWALLSGGVLAGLCSWLFDVRAAPFSAGMALWTAMAGLAGLLAYVCLFVAFANARLVLAVPLVSSWSLISAAISLVILGERVRGLQIVGAGLVFLGVVLVSVAGGREQKVSASTTGGAGPQAPPPGRWALWAALGSGVGFGVMVPATGQVAPALGEFGAVVAVYGIGLVLATPLALVARVNVRLPPRAAWGLVFMTGVAETAGLVFVALARRFAPMALVAPVASLASALTVLYAWLVLRERPDLFAGIGAALASIGIVVLAL